MPFRPCPEGSCLESFPAARHPSGRAANLVAATRGRRQRLFRVVRRHGRRPILQRVETRDYVDVDALLRSGLSLSAGIAGARLLFPAFAPQECLKALTYFEDEALRDLPPDLEARLLSAVRTVRSIPIVTLASSTQDD